MTRPVALFLLALGLELLKNEYPQKALVRLRRAFESDKHNAYYSSFLGLAIARAQRKWDQASELCHEIIAFPSISEALKKLRNRGS